MSEDRFVPGGDLSKEYAITFGVLTQLAARGKVRRKKGDDGIYVYSLDDVTAWLTSGRDGGRPRAGGGKLSPTKAKKVVKMPKKKVIKIDKAEARELGISEAAAHAAHLVRRTKKAPQKTKMTTEATDVFDEWMLTGIENGFLSAAEVHAIHKSRK